MSVTEEDRKILERNNYKCELCGRECEADAERKGRMRTFDVSIGMQVDDRSADGKVSVCLECIGRVHEVAHNGQTKEDRVAHLRGIVRAQFERERAAIKQLDPKRLDRPRGAGGASDGPPAPPTWTLHLPDDELIKHLALAAGEVADRKAAKRDMQWRTLFGLIALGFAWLGMSELGKIRADARESAKLTAESVTGEKIKILSKEAAKMVSKEVDDQLDKKLGVLAIRIALEQDELRGLERNYDSLRWLLQSLEGKDGFTNQQRDQALELFERISTSKEMVSRHDYLQIAEGLLDLFAAADLGHLVDEIDDALKERATSNLGIAGTLIQHYGRLAIGSPYPLERIPELVARFEKYAKGVRELRYPEVALPFELLLEFRRSNLQTNQTIDGLVKAIPDLTMEERRSFFNTLDSLRDPTRLAFQETAEIRKIVATANAFYEAYKTKLDEYAKGAIDPEQARMRSIIEGPQEDESVPPDSE